MKRSKTGSIKRAKPLLGTFVIASVKGPDEATAQLALDAAFAAVEKVQRLMSAYDPESDISRLSRQGPFLPLSVDPWTYEVLALSRSVSLASGGIFDVTVGGKLEKLGFLPGGNPLARSWGEANYADIDLLEESRIMLRRSCRLDLGGVAKGYAVDRALEAALQIPGVKDVVVNAGGDLRIKTESPQAVWVRDPFRPDHFWPGGYMTEGAMASSGGVGAQRDSKQGLRTPLLRQGQAQAPKLVSGVTVLAGTCAVADALTKVALLAPDELRKKVFNSFQARVWDAVKEEGFREVSEGSAAQRLAK